MDDIRRPQHLKRRDYSIPANRPVAPPHRHEPHHASHQPAAHHRDQHQELTANNQYSQPKPQTFQPQPEVPTYHQPSHQAHHQTASATHAPTKRFRLSGKSISVAMGVLIAAAAIFGAGYLLKGSNDSKGIPASIARQVNYDLYFPSPMPSGYIYMKDTATFQIGQVFYKFANGKKRVTVNEQPMPD
ncbi:hypothetical protein KW794_00390, partial [Candidatus Saccharibacteria bacterium]|nr:hypothetical protein [Candidatus Saccharibacteria bacterium]